VVAIISILAAIAVPNFLDAQARSKVSRVKADMRTIVMAIETYHVDETNIRAPSHPRQPGRRQSPLLLPEFGNRLRQMSVLTTPISYLTFLPMDIFDKWNPGPTRHRLLDIDQTYWLILNKYVGPNQKAKVKRDAVGWM